MRTGTQLLSTMLHEAGIGNADEHLAATRIEPTIEALAEKVARNQQGDYIGSKVHYGQLVPYVEQWNIPDFEVLTGISDVLKPEQVYYIHMYRRDKVRQAASTLRAEQVGQWHATRTEEVNRASVVYDYRRMRELVDMFEVSDDNWRCAFQRYNVKPLEIIYEDLSDDIIGTFNCVTRHLGANVEAPEPTHKKLAGKDVEEIVRRYKADIASSAAD